MNILNYTTPEAEHLSLCLDPIDGLSYFAYNFCYVKTYQGKVIQLRQKLKDKNLFKTVSGKDTVFAQMHRQSGKTTSLAVIALWYAMFTSRQVSLVCCNYEMCKIVATIIDELYSNLPDYIKCSLTSRAKNKFSFATGSEIRISSTNCRSRYRHDILLIDEPMSIDNFDLCDNYNKLVIASTAIPTKLRLLYNKCATSSDERCAVFSASWKDDYDLDEAWADRLKQYMGVTQFVQEFEV